MSLLEKIRLFVSNEMLLFEFAHGVKKIRTEESIAWAEATVLLWTLSIL